MGFLKCNCFARSKWLRYYNTVFRRQSLDLLAAGYVMMMTARCPTEFCGKVCLASRVNKLIDFYICYTQ